MREIKFRGKCEDTGELIVGYYGYKELTDEHFIIVPTFDSHSDNRPQYFTDYLVDPESVGQYTGLKDKNGKEIFEGDILSHEKFGTLKVVFQSGKFDCVDNLNCSVRSLGKINEWTTILGNIWDNPELLK